MNTEPAKIVRQARGGGTWFPAEPRALQRMVSGYIEEAAVPDVEGRIVAAISPHAGYIYSGRVAGYTFRAIRDDMLRGHGPETMVILGFSHRSAFRGVALMDGDAVGTPLGEAALDKEAGAVMIGKRTRLVFDHRPHADEHSAENQIPFAQMAAPAARLVVALIGEHHPETLSQLASALKDLSRIRKIVVLASSDMLHDPDYDLVTRTDHETLRKVEAMDDGAVLGDWSAHTQTFCGIMPVVTAMRFAAERGCRKGLVLHYRNSGDDYPESRGQWVVGYGAVAFSAPCAGDCAKR